MARRRAISALPDDFALELGDRPNDDEERPTGEFPVSTLGRGSILTMFHKREGIQRGRCLV